MSSRRREVPAVALRRTSDERPKPSEDALALRGCRRFVVRTALLAICLFAAVAATGPAAALACGASPFGHYVAIFHKTSASANSGLYSDVYIPTSGVADYASGGHINGTIWEAVSNATSTSQYWVETGWTHGWLGTAVYTFYWARNTPANGYAQHKVNNISVTTNSWMPMQVSYNGNSIWSVYLNFVKATSSDGSTANITAGLYSKGYSGGIESTSNGSWAGTGYWSDLEDLKSGSWTSSIDSGSTLYCDPPSSSSWVTTNVELRAAF